MPSVARIVVGDAEGTEGLCAMVASAQVAKIVALGRSFGHRNDMVDIAAFGGCGAGRECAFAVAVPERESESFGGEAPDLGDIQEIAQAVGEETVEPVSYTHLRA